MFKSRLLIYFASILGLLLGASPAPSLAEDSFKIGWIGALTGPTARYGAGQSALLAVDEVNESGGVLGRRLELVQEDGQGKGAVAISALQKLTEIDQLKFILGGHCTPESAAIAPLAKQKNVLLLAAITSSPKLTGINPNFLRITHVSTVVGELLAHHAVHGAQLSNFAVLQEETDYVLPVAEAFKKTMIGLGGKIVLDESFASGESDFRSLVARIKNSGAQALYLGTQSQDMAALIMRQLRSGGVTLPVYGNEVVGNTPAGNPLVAPQFKDTIFAEPVYDETTELAAQFIKNYKARYHTSALPLGLLGAEAYDSVRLLAATINRCGDDVARVRECLLQTKDFPGASGQIEINALGDGVRKVVVKKLDDQGHKQILFSPA